MMVCKTCGNTYEPSLDACPYCGAKRLDTGMASVANEDSNAFGTCPECGHSSSGEEEPCPRCKTVPAHLKAYAQAADRMSSLREEKRWRGILRTAAALPDATSVPGAKGRLLQRTVKRYVEEATRKRTRTLQVKSAIDKAIGDQQWEVARMLFDIERELGSPSDDTDETEAEPDVALQLTRWEDACNDIAAHLRTLDVTAAERRCRNYIDEFPSGRYLSDAQEWLEVALPQWQRLTNLYRLLETARKALYERQLGTCRRALNKLFWFLQEQEAPDLDDCRERWDDCRRTGERMRRRLHTVSVMRWVVVGAVAIGAAGVAVWLLYRAISA